MRSSQLFIDSQWVDGSSDETLTVTEPASGAIFGEAAMATPDDARAAIAGAAKAEAALDQLTFFERAELLYAVADQLDANATELAEQLSRESGKPLVAECQGELAESAEIFRLAAEEIKRLETHVLPSVDPNKRAFTFRKPNGIYALITPWNFPMNIPAELVAAALAGGNPVVLKPSELTPFTGAALVRAIEEAGFPPGSISLVNGRADVGAALVEDPRVAGIGFVGSKETAAHIVAAAGMKRTLIEASGNGPQIVCADADIERAAAAAVFGAQFVAGQCCVATERVLVHQAVHREFMAALVACADAVVVGDPLNDETMMGSLNNEKVAARVDEHLADAMNHGCEIVRGGSRLPELGSNLFYELTIIDGVTPKTLLFRDETFGPVLPITTFADNDEALRLANDSDLGLQASVFTESLPDAYRFIENLRTGTVVVNESVSYWETHTPFGGAAGTNTGWGRIGGRFTLHDMTDLRTAIIDVGTRR